MMKSAFINKVALVLVLGFVSTACSSRYIITAADDPKGRATIMKTVDIKNYLVIKVVKDVFWECTDQKDGLRCEKVCDREDTEGNQIVCPKYKTQTVNLQ